MYRNEKPTITLDSQNDIFRLAQNFINYTNEHVFLTGKAGTGKTTFLKYIKDSTYKEVVVAAPTGVAAINAEGVTLHSLFQLPFEPFIPTIEARRSYISGNRFRMNKTKIELLRKLELLIIDEVSMLRADLLDAIDYLLKHFRQSNKPFGGIQMLYIGDLFQLPPVVKDEEWKILQHYYQSPFFFHAKAVEENPPIYIELKNIYRQNERMFINLLNAVRNNNLAPEDMDLINSRYNPYFQPSEDDKRIVLCTHNYKADYINQEKLDNLTGKIHTFDGDIKGDFPNHILPTEKKLLLKEGTQIMFIKNDIREPRRYYNGKIATVVKIKNEKITVVLADTDIHMELEKEVWRNIRYTQNKQYGFIEEEELGSFTQYPVRLAWAITIHKSQGLTFEKVIIDAEKAFAPGQVYVALSRCTTLEGIVLYSQIGSSVITNPFVLQFANTELPVNELDDLFEEQRKIYCRNRLLGVFDFSELQKSVNTWEASLPDTRQLSCFEASRELLSQLIKSVNLLARTGRKFQSELEKLITDRETNNEVKVLQERVAKAANYFYHAIQENVLLLINTHQVHFKKEKKLKEYLKTLEKLQKEICYSLKKLERIYYGEMIISEIENPEEKNEVKEITSNIKKTKGGSALESLNMFRNGLRAEEISKERNLSLNTINNHLYSFIPEGKISITEIIPDENKVTEIINAIEKAGREKLKPIKELLSDDFSYDEIKAVVNYVIYREK